MLADQAGPDFLAVDPQEHPVETLLEDAAGVVRGVFAGEGDDLRGGVLDHHGAVLVVEVDQRDGVLAELVEEAFLAAEILGEGLVVVEVVVRQVGEDGDLEAEARDAFLLDADRADFHEAVFAAGGDHLCEEGVQRDRVGGRVGGLAAAASDKVGNRGEQAAAISETAEEVIEERDRGGLPVGAGDADEGQLL